MQGNIPDFYCIVQAVPDVLEEAYAYMHRTLPAHQLLKFWFTILTHIFADNACKPKLKKIVLANLFCCIMKKGPVLNLDIGPEWVLSPHSKYRHAIYIDILYR